MVPVVTALVLRSRSRSDADGVVCSCFYLGNPRHLPYMHAYSIEENLSFMTIVGTFKRHSCWTEVKSTRAFWREEASSHRRAGRN